MCGQGCLGFLWMFGGVFGGLERLDAVIGLDQDLLDGVLNALLQYWTI